jgi:hypothetical protein
MPHLTSLQKHNILRSYTASTPKITFESLAQQHNIKGGGRVIQRWYSRWNGKPQSLQRQKGSGRPSILSTQDINNYIKTPIRNKNRSFTPIHYPELKSTIIEKTGKPISIQTVRRIGKTQLGVKQKRTKKRTIEECKQLTLSYSPSSSLVLTHSTNLLILPIFCFRYSVI